MKQLLIALTAVALLLQWGGGPLRAESRQMVVAKAEIDYPPYQFEKDGKVSGICVEIIEQTARLLDIGLVYRKYPWKRMLYYAEKGRVDAVMPLFKTPARQRFLVFPEAELVFEENVLFVHRDSTIEYAGDPRSLRPYTIGVVQGYSYGGQFDRIQSRLNKDVSINDYMLVDKFKRGRFQIGIGNRHVLKYYARQLQCEAAMRFLEPIVTREPLYIGFSRAKGHEALAAEFSKAMETFRKTDAYRQLLDRYGFHR